MSSTAFAALSLIDIKTVRRDPMLRWLMIYPIFFVDGLSFEIRPGEIFGLSIVPGVNRA